MRLFTTSFTLLSDMFVVSIGDLKNDRIETHIISFLADDFYSLILHLEEIRENNYYTIGFNNLKTEIQLFDYILRYKDQLEQKEIGKRIKDINDFYNEILRGKTKQKDNEELLIKHIDLAIILREDNKTLQHIKASFRELNINSKINPTQKELKDRNDLNLASIDNVNNIALIKKIAQENKKKIKVKITFQKIIKREIINKTPTAITQIIFKKNLSKTKAEPQKTTQAKSIIDKRLFSIKNSKFKYVLEQFAIKRISDKSKIDIEVLERGLNIVFSKSGIHAAKKGFHTAPNDFTIINLDAKSYFTSIIINLNLCPLNYGRKGFSETLTSLHAYRNSPKISKEMKSFVKGILSNVSGLSNSTWSDMYDPEFYYAITLNGQLYLYLLFCMLADAEIGFVPLMQNTDGITFIYKDSALDELDNIIKRWSKYTGIVLTKEFYRQMLIKDVGSYVGVGIQKEVSKSSLSKYDINGFDYMKFMEDEKLYVSKLSCVGTFGNIIKNDYSYRNMPIIAKAVLMYYFYGVNPIDTLRKETDIFMFMSYLDSTDNLKVIDKSDLFSREESYIEGLSRYVVTIHGQSLERRDIVGGDKLLFVSSDYLTTNVNDLKGRSDCAAYTLNLGYYEKQTLKVLNVLSPGSFAEQTKMF